MIERLPLDAAAFTPHILVCLVALGMALSFIAADRDSPTSRALAVGFAFIGIGVDLNIVVALQWHLPMWVHGAFALPETISIVALLEWILLVRRTIPAGALNTSAGDRALRAGQAAALFYGAAALALPEVRSRQFLGVLADPDGLRRWGFWLFALPILFSAFTALGAIALTLNRKPDLPERTRVLAMAAAIPFFVAGFVVPLGLAPIAMVIGEMIVLVGAVQYHVMQGQRGQFMSRFLSSQVAELVRSRGLKHAMQQASLEITVVCCDLRGFTPYAQAHDSARVLNVLKEYYDAAGIAVAAHAGTIKDFAGDGILILVGAPIPADDHARRGLELARELRNVGREVTARWSTPEHRLGIGVGVASGRVTVGVIGSASRLEYTAVGAAVNLASRLCGEARDGEILVDPHAARLAEGAPLEARQALAIKGFAEPVPTFALPA